MINAQFLRNRCGNTPGDLKVVKVVYVYVTGFPWQPYRIVRLLLQGVVDQKGHGMVFLYVLGDVKMKLLDVFVVGIL